MYVPHRIYEKTDHYEREVSMELIYNKRTRSSLLSINVRQENLIPTPPTAFPLLEFIYRSESSLLEHIMKDYCDSWDLTALTRTNKPLGRLARKVRPFKPLPNPGE